MRDIFVYNSKGVAVDCIRLQEDVEYISGRTSKSSDCYYKGVGAFYKCHATINSHSYKRLGKNPVFYYGDDVVNENWIDKYGIFQERFQPYFSDFIGSCGVKEESILDKSVRFERSAVSVVEAVLFDSVNKQSYYKLNYVSPRNQYIKGVDSRALLDLMHYMTVHNWNFPWDKASIRDINQNGYITDVADIFESVDIKHKYGSIYSILYSLNALCPLGYLNLLSTLGLENRGVSDIPFVVSFLLRLFGFTVPMRLDIQSREDAYTHLIGNILLRGRNCACVEDINNGNNVMVDYVERFRSALPKGRKNLLEVLK